MLHYYRTVYCTIQYSNVAVQVVQMMVNGYKTCRLPLDVYRNVNLSIAELGFMFVLE